MKLIKDTWYKSENNNYYKFLKEENNWYYYSERIYNKILSGGQVVWGGGLRGKFSWFKTPISLAEIQDYLPDNHPDKFLKEVIQEDYNYLIELLNKLNIN